jgi:hypothetical protein
MSEQPQPFNIMDHHQFPLRKYANFTEPIAVYETISKPNDIVKKLLTLTKATVQQDPAPWKSDQGTKIHVFHQIFKHNEYAAVCFFNVKPVWPNFAFNTRNGDESLAVLLPAFQQLCDDGDLQMVEQVQKHQKTQHRQLYNSLKARPVSVYIDITTGLDAGEWGAVRQQLEEASQGSSQSAVGRVQMKESGRTTQGSGYAESSETQYWRKEPGENRDQNLDRDMFDAFMAEILELSP